MAGIDFTQFNFGPEQIRNINELIMEQIVEAPELRVLHTVYPGVASGKYIGFIGEGGLVGIKGQGCDPQPQDWTVPANQKLCDPKPWEVLLKECAKDLENTMVIYSMNKGVDRADLTETDYMSIVVDVLTKVIKKAIWRMVWFNDTDAENISGGGIITNGVDLKYFDILDGLWKQIFAAVPSGSAQRVNIAANAAATYSDQRSQLTGLMVYNALENMYYNAGMKLRQDPGLMFACTQSFADGYCKYLQGKDLEATFINVIDGVQALKFNNIPVVAIPLWDEMIQMYEDNGSKWNNPHRCILTSPENLAIGVPDTDALTTVDVWYDKTTRFNYMYAADSIDALLLDEKRIMLAI